MPAVILAALAAKEIKMKAYGGSEKCLPFEYYLKKPDSEDDLESLIRGKL